MPIRIPLAFLVLSLAACPRPRDETPTDDGAARDTAEPGDTGETGKAPEPKL